MRKALVLASALAFAAIVASPALAQSDPALRNVLQEVERLQRDVTDLQRQLYGQRAGGAITPGSSAPGGPTAEFLLQDLPQIQQQIRDLTGLVEKADFEMRSLKQRLDKLVNDVDFRLSKIEGDFAALKGGAPPAQAGAPGTPPAAGSDQPPRSTTPGVLGTLPVVPPGQQPQAQQQAAKGVLPQGTPKERYDHALRLLRQSDYDIAEQAFREWVNAHPKDPLASNAWYWLGETHYVRADHGAGAKAFLEGYKSAPKGDKAPDNLLKLGMSLTNLNQKTEACNTFAQLGTEFPNAPANIKQTLARERQRAGCKA
jgi:tol-pal system protein YbgF